MRITESYLHFLLKISEEYLKQQKYLKGVIICAKFCNSNNKK